MKKRIFKQLLAGCLSAALAGTLAFSMALPVSLAEELDTEAVEEAVSEEETDTEAEEAIEETAEEDAEEIAEEDASEGTMLLDDDDDDEEDDGDNGDDDGDDGDDNGDDGNDSGNGGSGDGSPVTPTYKAFIYDENNKQTDVAAVGEEDFYVEINDDEFGGELSYKSSNTSVAKIDEDGYITIGKTSDYTDITVSNVADEDYNAYSTTVRLYVVPGVTRSMSATPGKTIKISWAAVSGADGYYLYRNNQRIYTATKGSIKSYTDKSVKSGGKYTYKLYTYKKFGSEIKYSTRSYATYTITNLPIPSAPSGLKAANSTSKKVMLSWRQATNATQYRVQYANNKAFKNPKTKTTKKTTFTIGGQKVGSTCYIRVYSLNKTQPSSKFASKTVKIKK